MRVRLLRLAVAAALTSSAAAAGVGAAVDAAPNAARHCSTQTAGPGWLASNPGFPSGPHDATQVVAVPYVPDRLYATNGAVLMLTDDAGCSWHDMHVPAPHLGGVSLPVVGEVGGVAAPNPGIASVAVPSSATSNGYVYVGVNAGASVAQQPSIYTSVDAGRTWAQPGSGLPHLGTVREVAASPLVPTIAYAVVDGVAGQAGGLYATEDGGKTWTKRADVTAAQSLRQLRVEPAVANRLYALDTTGLVISGDGGANFHRASRTASDVHAYDVAPGNGFSRLVQGHSAYPAFDLSGDGGSTWASFPARVKVVGIAAMPLVSDVVITDSQNVIVEHQRTSASGGGAYDGTAATPTIGPPTDLQVSAPVNGAFAISGLAHGVIVRSIYSLTTTHLLKQSLVPIRLQPHGALKQFPSTLLPLHNVVKLAAGAHKDVPFQLLAPRTPSPVDVMFLLDTSSSTEPTIDGLRRDVAAIAKQLDAGGLDVRMGLGDFRDYPYDVNGNGDLGDYPYRLRFRLSPDVAGLGRAINGLHDSGGGDVPESDLTALYQSTTGIGQKVNGRWMVKPGEEAGYRYGSLRLAIIATDERYHQESDYLTPSWSKTVAALNAQSVHQVGLAMQSFEGGKKDGFHSAGDEARMALATGAVAVRGGVDCNGDGVTDLQPGAALVCPIAQGPPQQIPGTDQFIKPPAAEVHLANAIAALAAIEPDYRGVALSISGAPASVAHVTSTPSVPTVNMHADNALPYTVRLSCPLAKLPHTYHLAMGAQAGAAALPGAASSTDLVCGPVAPKPPAVPPIAAAAAAAPVVGAAAAPGPVQPPQAPSNVNPNPAVNANPGFAQQDEQQQQLAFADADNGIEEDTSMAMSRRPSADETAFMLGAAGLMTAAAAGYAVRTRRRTAHGTARAYR